MFDPSEFERAQRQLAAQLEELSQKFVKAFNGLPKVLREAFDSGFAEKFLKVVQRIADANGETVKELEKQIKLVEQDKKYLEDQVDAVQKIIDQRRKQSREQQKIIKQLMQEAKTQDEINYLQKEAAEGIKEKNRDIDKLAKILNNVKAGAAGAAAQLNALKIKLNAVNIANQQGLAIFKAFGMTLPQLQNKLQAFKNNWLNVGGAVTAAGIGVGLLVKQMIRGYEELRRRGFDSQQAITHVPDVFMAQVSGIRSGVFASQQQYASNYGNLANYLGQTDLNRGLTVAATKLSAKRGGYGLSTEEASHLVGQLNRINNYQAQTATHALITARALAAINNMPVGTVMKDLASHSEAMAMYAGRGTEQLTKSLIVTRQMGVEFNKISNFADSMVDDFEQSLKTQAELQTYLPGLDLSEVMYASQFGTEAQVSQALQSALQSTGLKTLDQLPRSVRNRVVGLLGQGAEGAQNLLGQNAASSNGFKTNTSGYSDTARGFEASLFDMIASSKMATGALGLLAASASIAALNMAGRSAIAGRAAFAASRAGGAGFLGGSGAALKSMGGAAAIGGVIGGGLEVWNSRDQGASWGRSLARGLVTGGLAALGTVGGAFIGGPIGAAIGGAIAGRFGTWLDDKFIPIQPQQLRYPEGYALNQSVQNPNAPGGSQQQKVPVDTSALEKKLDTLISLQKNPPNIFLDGRKVGKGVVDAYSRD